MAAGWQGLMGVPIRPTSQRKVRAPQDLVVGNSHRPKG